MFALPRLERNRIRRIHIPGLGKVAFALDAGEALTPGHLMFHTHLEAQHIRDGAVIQRHDLGSGVVTIGLVNTLVSDAVTGASVVPTLKRYLGFHDSGTGTTAATDGDPVLVTQAGPATRATATLTNAQSATTGNHTAKLQSQGTIAYTSTLAITEWGAFDQAAQGGNLGDRRTFAAINVVSGDGIQFTYVLSLPSNG